MNRQMWANAANQRNVARLIADGVTVLGPGNGDQACGETGDGRMLEPEEIFAALTAAVQPKLLAGKPLAAHRRADVRSDRSRPRHHQHELGQDGIRARAGRRRGGRGGDARRADPTPLAAPPGVERIDVVSAAAMSAAVDANLDGVRRLHRRRRGRRLHARLAGDDQDQEERRTADDHVAADGRHSRHRRRATRTRPTASASPRKPTTSRAMPTKSGAARSCR